MKPETHITPDYAAPQISEGISVGTIGKKNTNVDYNSEFPNIRMQEKKLISHATGIIEQNIIFLNQVHGDTILVSDKTTEPDNLYFGDADAVITGTPGICLVIRTADCVPVFLYDPDKKILGAVHSGWKGCRLNISGKTVRKMQDEFNSTPENISAFILPSIGPDSYSIKDDVAQFFKNDTERKNGRIYLNMWKNIENSLIETGLPKNKIHISGICNHHNDDQFFSYRSGDTGRNLNFGLIL